MRNLSSIGVVRFGQAFYVVRNPPRSTHMTQQTAERSMLAKFEFAGDAKRSNPHAAKAFADATAYSRTAIKEAEHV